MMLRSLTCLNRLVDVLDHGFVQFRTGFRISTDADGDPIMARFQMIYEADLPKVNGLFLNLIWTDGEIHHTQKVFIALRDIKFIDARSNIIDMLLPGNILYFKKAMLYFFHYLDVESRADRFNLESYTFQERTGFANPVFISGQDTVFYVINTAGMREENRNQALADTSFIPTPAGPAKDSIDLGRDDKDNVVGNRAEPDLESPTAFIKQCKVETIEEDEMQNIQRNGFFFTLSWKKKGKDTTEAMQAVFLCCAVEEIEELRTFISKCPTKYGVDFQRLFINYVHSLRPNEVNNFDILVRNRGNRIDDKTNKPYGGQYLFYIIDM
jgi:hypothetical protein